MLRPQFREEIKRWGFYMLFVYLVLLMLSHYHLREMEPPKVLERDARKKVVMLDGKRLAYLEWGGADVRLPPLILLHGSPASGAHDWDKFASALALSGRRIIAIDRWGYGDSERKVDDYSFKADAKAVLGLMGALGIERAHVGGWSYSGGSVILLGGDEENRILSTALIAAIGIQEGEGTGSYTVEHWKYAALDVIVNWVPELIPHFGLLGPRAGRRAFARDFMDCDQRELKRRLSALVPPMFIIHGKHDPLIAAWVAQEHHRLKPTSRLVILDSSHFFAFGVTKPENFEIAVDELTGFLAAVDAGSEREWYGVRNETSRENLRALWDGGPAMRGYKPWWLIFLAGLAAGWFIPRSGAAIIGVAGGLLLLDPLTGLLGAIIGGSARREEFRSRYHKAGLVCLFGILGSIAGMLLLPIF